MQLYYDCFSKKAWHGYMGQKKTVGSGISVFRCFAFFRESSKFPFNSRILHAWNIFTRTYVYYKVKPNEGKYSVHWVFGFGDLPLDELWNFEIPWSSHLKKCSQTFWIPPWKLPKMWIFRCQCEFPVVLCHWVSGLFSGSTGSTDGPLKPFGWYQVQRWKSNLSNDKKGPWLVKWVLGGDFPSLCL